MGETTQARKGAPRLPRILAEPATVESCAADYRTGQRRDDADGAARDVLADARSLRSDTTNR